METNAITSTILSNMSEFYDKSGLAEVYVRLSPNSGKLVILNNSFFFREKTYIKTNKNEKYPN